MNRFVLRVLPLVLGLALAAVPALPAASQPTTPDPRFGVVVVGAGESDPSYVPAALSALGASSWYNYQGMLSGLAGQVGLILPGANLDEVAQRAAANPGGAWMISNEPNVPGRNTLSPQQFSDLLAQSAAAIKGADPTAILVGPNILNWDKTCSGCPGYAQGHGWSDEFLADYTARYGALPLDVWGIHVYSLDWDRLPLIDADADLAQLAAARAWLDAQGLNLPIWVTEFGIIWGYDGVEPVPQPDGSNLAKPAGQFRTDLMLAYLDQMFGWLTANGPTMRIERWFLYATSPTPEPYATDVGGITLLQPNSLTLTPFGERFRSWATGQATGSGG